MTIFLIKPSASWLFFAHVRSGIRFYHTWLCSFCSCDVVNLSNCWTFFQQIPHDNSWQIGGQSPSDSIPCKVNIIKKLTDSDPVLIPCKVVNHQIITIHGLTRWICPPTIYLRGMMHNSVMTSRCDITCCWNRASS